MPCCWGAQKALFAGVTPWRPQISRRMSFTGNGLQRARFLPAIDAIHQHYRHHECRCRRRLSPAHLNAGAPVVSPLNAETASEMDNLAGAGRRCGITPQNWRLIIARCRRSALKPTLAVSGTFARTPAASMTTLRFHACSIPLCCGMCR